MFVVERVWSRRFAVGLALGFLSGCGGGEEEELDEQERVLAPLSGLRELEAKDDPLAEERPDVIDCNPLTGWYAEDGGLEINTGRCNYAALGEPIVVSVHADDTVTGTISHYDLTAPEPSEAHLALFLGDILLFERRIPVPGAANVLNFSTPLSRDVKKDTLLVLHLHNHGQNTWKFEPLHVRTRSR